MAMRANHRATKAEFTAENAESAEKKKGRKKGSTFFSYLFY
jgi:hypothetical protein